METAKQFRAIVRKIDQLVVSATAYVMIAWMLPFCVAMVLGVAGIQSNVPGWVPVYFSVTIIASVFLMGGSVVALYIDERLYLAIPEPDKCPEPYHRPAPVFEPSGYVYLLRAHDGLYKIGHTANPDNRLRTFEVRLPFFVEYEHLIPCENRLKAEATLHSRYAAQRVHGEWFRLTDTQVAEIKAIERM